MFDDACARGWQVINHENGGASIDQLIRAARAVSGTPLRSGPEQVPVSADLRIRLRFRCPPDRADWEAPGDCFALLSPGRREAIQPHGGHRA